MRPDPRTEPREYADHVAAEYKRFSYMYKRRDISEDVYCASLYALGWRGADIRTEAALNAPDPIPVQPPKYRVQGGVVVLNRR